MADLVERSAKMVRSIPLPLLIALVWAKGFAYGWVVGRLLLQRRTAACRTAPGCTPD